LYRYWEAYFSATVSIADVGAFASHFKNLQKSLRYTNFRYQSAAASLLPLQMRALAGNVGKLSTMVGQDVNGLATICLPILYFLKKKGQTSLDLNPHSHEELHNHSRSHRL
jgi:hypothetical protein